MRFRFASMVAFMLMLSLPAFAADVPPVVAENLVGQLLQGLVGLVFAGLAAALPWLFKLLIAASHNAALTAVLDVIALKVQSAVRQGEEVLRPMLQRALADGKLDEREQKELKARVLDLVKSGAVNEIHLLTSKFGFLGPMVDHLLSDLIEKAVTMLDGAPTVPGTDKPIEKLA